jgi:FkbM family methyltransferase
MVLRTVVERFSRNRVLKRRLPPEFGSRAIWVSPDSALQYWKRDISTISPELFTLASKLVRPDALVWDIGANVGVFSFAAAAKAGIMGRVLAIEPDPWLGALLRRSTAESVPNTAPVEVLNVAIADRLRIAEFNVARRGRSSNFVSGFGLSETGGSRTSFPVMAITLDWLAENWAMPSVIKIDIEGMELLALRGAMNVLKSRPTLIMEVTQRNSAEIFQTLTALQYKLLDTNLQAFEVNPNMLPPNIVALPNS